MSSLGFTIRPETDAEGTSFYMLCCDDTRWSSPASDEEIALWDRLRAAEAALAQIEHYPFDVNLVAADDLSAVKEIAAAYREATS